MLDDVRAVLGNGPGADEDVVRAGLVFGVVEMGWNLAWQVAQDAPAARDTFDWWVEAARRGAGTGLLG